MRPKAGGEPGETRPGRDSQVGRFGCYVTYCVLVESMGPELGAFCEETPEWDLPDFGTILAKEHVALLICATTLRWEGTFF